MKKIVDVQALIDLANNSVYPLQAIVALVGAYCVILVFMRIRKKAFRGPPAQRFMQEVQGLLKERKYDEIAQLCDSPPYWSKAVPQLMLLVLSARDRELGALRRMVAEKFERDVLAELDYRMSWVNTVVKSAPMLGLLGTVLGMISAFGKIASSQKGGNDATMLASDISFALITTAVGLIIAIPLVMCQSAIAIQMGKLQDSVQQYVGEFLESFEISRSARSRRA